MKNFREFKENYRLTGLSESFNDSIYESEDSSSFKFKLVSGKDIMKYYSENTYEIDRGSLGASPMRLKSKNKFMRFYADLNPKICSLLVYINESTDKIAGRALLWKLDSGKMYLDRIHVVDVKMEQLFIDYAKKTYGSQFNRDKNKLTNFETITLKNTKINKQMPSLDTFINAIQVKEDLILFNSPANSKFSDFIAKYPKWIYKYLLRNENGTYEEFKNPDYRPEETLKNFKFVDGLTIEKIMGNDNLKWILNANPVNATIGYDRKTDRLIWYDGLWKYDVWENGIWKGGTWQEGIWKGGTWENGVWKDGVWRGGVWENGLWKHGVWENSSSIWEDGTWEDGIWKEGTWNGGTWKGGTWKGGTWNGGTWEDGKGKPENAK